MGTETVIIAGVTFLGHDALTFGDYGGSGSYGRANIDDVLEEFNGHVHETSYQAVTRATELSEYRWPEAEELIDAVKTGDIKVIHCTGMYSSETVYIREDVATDIIGALEGYPVLDECRMSRVEMEWEQEAWKSWLQRDLLDTLPDDYDDDGHEDQSVQEQAGELPEETLWECYREAMEKTNTYPVAEYSGVHVDVDRIKAAFLDAVLHRLAPAEAPGVIKDKRQQEIPL